MLYVLSGQDDYSLTQSLEEIKKEIGEQALLMTDITTLDGQQVTLDQLRIVCDTVPFLGGKRLVVIKGLLERFESKGRPGRQQKTRRTGQADESKSLGDCINKMPDSTVLVLLEGSLANNNPLFKELSDRAVVKTFPLLKSDKLRQWVQRRVKEEGGSISPQAVDLLTRFVGGDLWIMASEINKLVLFAAERRIEAEDVEAIVSYAQQTSVFAMVDAVVEFKAEMAQRLLQQLLQRGAAPAYLLAMLSRQVRMIVRARELKKQRKSGVEIQNKLGLRQEFALRRTLEQAGRYSLPRLKQVYHRLLEADLSIKTGKYDAELALDILVAELCRQRRTYTRS